MDEEKKIEEFVGVQFYVSENRTSVIEHEHGSSSCVGVVGKYTTHLLGMPTVAINKERERQTLGWNKPNMKHDKPWPVQVK